MAGPLNGCGEDEYRGSLALSPLAGRPVDRHGRCVAVAPAAAAGLLETGAGAHRSAVLDPPAESEEQRTGPLGIGRRGAKEADELALAGGAGRAPDRALDEGGLLGPYRSGKRDLGGRLHRAHFDEQLSLDV